MDGEQSIVPRVPSTVRDYLTVGLALVPIPRGSKGPKAAGWNLRENCIFDPSQASRLEGLNIGLAHLYSGTCALDIDNAELALPWLRQRGIDLAALVKDPTSVVWTSGKPGRGKLLYRRPPDVSYLATVQPVGSGLELRCATKDGSTTVQDVLPPSIHPDTGRPYVWLTACWPPPVLPEQLLSVWRITAGQPKPAAPANGAAAITMEGGRNNWLTTRAGQLRRLGFDEQGIEAALLAENAAHCVPPLDDDEVRAIAGSVSKYEPAPAAVADAETAIAALAALPGLEYEQKRAEEAKRLGMRVSVLDKAVSAKRPASVSDDPLAAICPSADPWPESVDGAALLSTIEAEISTYMTLPAHAAPAIALWIVWTYCLDARDTAPVLFFSSPTPACGKTTCMTLVARMACRPLMVSNMTAATLFRVIEALHPTLLIDEADSFAKDNEELRGILNSGHSREGAVVLRVEGDGDNRQVTGFSTWAPKALAAIGSLPGTIESRAIIIRLQRRAPGAKGLRLGRRKFAEVQQRATRWAADNVAGLAAFECEPPDWLDDRPFDSWLPLFAVAAMAGGDWPQRAFDAARELSGSGVADAATAGTGVELLADIRDVFARAADDPTGKRLPTSELIHRLCEDDSTRWCEYVRGQHITATQLARLLKPFGIKPGSIRMRDSSTPKGYKQVQFQDAFDRYLAHVPPGGDL